MARMKKIISAVLVIALVIAMIPMGFTKEPVHVKAEVSGIESGATYKIISAYNGKAITQTDVSLSFRQRKIVMVKRCMPKL